MGVGLQLYRPQIATMIGGWLRRLRYSLSARLMLLFLLTAVALAIVLNTAFSFAMRDYFGRVLRPHVVQYLNYIQQDLGDPPSIERAKALAERLPIEVYIRGPEVNWASSATPLRLDQVRFRDRRSRYGKRLAVADEGARFILRTLAGQHRIYFVVDNRDGRRGGPRALAAVLLTLAATLLVLYVCYKAIRRLFWPLQPIQTGVKRIGQGDLSHRIAIRRRDELGELGQSINAMADDIVSMLDAKRQLLLAISHELRSPLTRARVSLALIDNSDSKLKTAIDTDLREMEALISEIMESERLNSRHQVLDRSPTAVSQLLHELVEEHFHEPLKQGRLYLPGEEHDDYMLLDPARIKLLLKNLIDNALRYSPADDTAPVELASAVNESGLVLTVRDFGPGIAPEHIARLTEPFYRADPSRQRRTGGYGLGLYLCRAIAEAHGGRLAIASRPGETTVTVTIPPQS